MGKGTLKKHSLTNMDFGANTHQERSSRKQSMNPITSIHEAFKKVLAAIVSIKDTRPRLFSKRNSDMLKMDEAAGALRGKGTSNPMASPKPRATSKRAVPAPVFGSYNAGGGSNMPLRQQKKNGNDKKSSDKREKENDVVDIEDGSDFVSDNPRYMAWKRKEEKKKRLAAGESLEKINADFAKRKAKRKKNVVRSPLPPGV